MAFIVIRMTTRESNPAGLHEPLLLVDDDVKLCALMQEYFNSKNYPLDFVNNGRDGLARALNGEYGLVILDGMLPVLDGFEVLRQIRKRSPIPVIMLTARSKEQDCITGLDIGADDYTPKPFRPAELLARIRAVLRRYSVQRVSADVLQVGPIDLNPNAGIARCSGQLLNLTETELRILELLMRSVGQVVSRDEITAVLYQRKATAYERSLDVHVSHLRKKIEVDGAPLIRAIRGVGYVMSREEV